MPRAAIYLRVSTADQTVANQLPDLQRLAAARGLDCEVYEDVMSGSTFKRPAFERMMRDARQGKIQFILVWALDRLGRSMLKMIETVVELDRLGVSVVSHQETWLDTAGPTRGLLVAIIAWVAEQEKVRLIERTCAGIARARAAGKTLGRPRAELDLDELCRLRSNGLSIKQAAAKLGVGVGTVHRALQSSDVPASVRTPENNA